MNVTGPGALGWHLVGSERSRRTVSSLGPSASLQFDRLHLADVPLAHPQLPLQYGPPSPPPHSGHRGDCRGTARPLVNGFQTWG